MPPVGASGKPPSDRPGPARVTIEADGLPPRLAKPETSGLTTDVQGDVNPVIFDLNAEGIGTGEMIEHIRDRTIVVAFASLATLNDPAGSAQLRARKALRRTHAHRKDLLIMMMFIDILSEEGNDVKWSAFLLGEGRVDYGDGPRRFIDDSKWWCCTDLASWSAIATAPRFGVSHVPANFIIGPDGRFRAVRVPNASLPAAVAKALGADR